MITVKKIKSLKESTRFRKYVVILNELEEILKNDQDNNLIYYNSILSEIRQELNLPLECRNLANQEMNLRNISNLKFSIQKFLNIEPSEWDFTAPLDREKSSFKLGISMFLEDIRSPFNLGSLIRTGECFSVSKIYISENSTSPDHDRAKRTSMGCTELVDWEIKKLTDIEGPFFALELGGTPIDEFNFPQKGTVIIGSEELGVSPEALKIADNSLGRVTIPLTGSKSSLNVTNASAILLQRWHEKLLKS